MKLLLYSHDTYGLGHLRRSLAIAQAVVASERQAAVLIVTGSPRAHAFPVPAGCRIYSIPPVLKQADGSYISRDDSSSIEQLTEWRSRLIASAYKEFSPDIVLVDHAPLGVGNELEPVLKLIRADKPGVQLALGMRDIVDTADVVASAWSKSGALKALEDDYDRILVYGPASIKTTAHELIDAGIFSRKLKERISYVGYLSRPWTETKNSGRILVTTGGGGDGHFILRKFLRYLQSNPSIPGPIDLITGPFLSPRRRAQITSMAAELAIDICVEEFDPHLEDRIASSYAVICMAGYNTVTEVLNSGRPALFIPREKPRAEQFIRCERLHGNHNLLYCRRRDLDNDAFRRFFKSCETDSGRQSNQADFAGLTQLAHELRQMGKRRDGKVRDLESVSSVKHCSLQDL